MKKLVNLIILAVVFTAIFSSCSTQKATTVKTMDITNIGVIQKPVIVDLDIQQTKVKGTAQGKINVVGGIAAIKNDAVKSALKASDADVLIEPNFTVTTKNSIMTIEVTGYPAKYKNFRNIDDKDATWLDATNDIHKAKIYDPTKESDLTKEQPKKKKGWAIVGGIIGGIAIILSVAAAAGS